MMRKLSPMPEKKPTIHQSQLGTLARCGVAFGRRYGETFGIGPENEILPPGVAMARGTAVHSSVEHNMTHKIETGELAPLDECTDAASDSVNQLFAGEVMYTDEEAANPAATKAGAIDLAVDLSRLHYEELAPTIMPVAVEQSFRIFMPKYDYDLAGRIDIVEIGCVDDVKTTGKVPEKGAAKQSVQLQFYAMAKSLMNPKEPIPRARLSHLYRTPTTHKCRAICQEIQPTLETFKPALARIDAFMELIAAVRAGHQALSPADPSAWNCSTKWCGYAPSCPHYMGDA